MPDKFSLKLSDAAEAEIQAMIAGDPDNPELTDAQLKQGRPFKEALPDLYASIQKSRGRPPVENPKAAVTLRLDPRVVARFQAMGKDWRARMAEILEKAAL